MTCLRDHTPACRVPLLLEPLESRNLLSAGTFAVASGIVHSPENYGNFVTSLYENYLGRPPDPAGFNDWLGQLEQGRSPEEVEAGVVASPEYILEHGNDAALWLTGLYEDLLGREPDVEGMIYWQRQLAAGRGQFDVALGFTASVEREAIIIHEDYLTFLGRGPEPGKVDSWLAVFQARANRADVATDFVDSREFYVTHGDNDVGFIIGAYQTVLERTPRADEIDVWLGVHA